MDKKIQEAIMANYKTVYPYIPNSEPNIKAQMLKEVNAHNVDE